METEIMSIENAEALSTVTSTLSSLIPIDAVSKAVVDDANAEHDHLDGDTPRDKVLEAAPSVGTAHSYESSLERMDTLSSNDQVGSTSFSDTVSSILSESLSFIDSSVKESGEHPSTKAMMEEVPSCDHEQLQPVDESVVSDDSTSDQESAKQLKRVDVEEQASALSLDLMSDFVAELWSETSTLYELRQNRASILSRQKQIEQTLDESVGIFGVEKRESDDKVKSDREFIEKYVDEILKHSDHRVWSKKDPMNIDFSVFIDVETKANRKEKQQIFNNLVFDTVNEALAQIRPNSKRPLSSIRCQLVESVQRMMAKLEICDTADRLKHQFGDNQDIDDRIRTISTEWIQRYEHSSEWTSSHAVFQREIKLRTADLIFDQIITDFVFELNQIERTREARIVEAEAALLNL